MTQPFPAIALRRHDGKTIVRICEDDRQRRNLKEEASRWSRIVRHRSRWASNAELRRRMDEEAMETLQALGLSDENHARLATEEAVCVALPAPNRFDWEAAALMPWEFLLTAATRELRSGPMFVSRSLQGTRKRRICTDHDVLFVESAPERLARVWDFSNERKLAEEYFGPPSLTRLKTPSVEKIGIELATSRYGIVHLTGFDSHQGSALLEGTSRKRVRDGFLLVDEHRTRRDVSAEDLPSLLKGKAQPSLIICNFWNSASRIAPMLLQAGVHAVVAMQDTIEDETAESFIGKFYLQLAARVRRTTLPAAIRGAFIDGLSVLHTPGRETTGSGIVLWERTDVSASASPTADAAQASTVRIDLVETEHDADRRSESEDPDVEEVRQSIRVVVKPLEEITFVLLHNGGELFEEFSITKLRPGQLRDLRVEVELYAGNSSYPFRTTLTLIDSSTYLTRLVRLALTGELARTSNEMLRSSLYVSVSWKEHRLFEETFPVTLNPVDQWIDSERDGHLLPSFIYPRDKAVARIIGEAQQLVTALRDDPAAGFDGYQPFSDAFVRNPALEVDRQVQALWYALGAKLPVTYINPPPTYSLQSQRIRVPSDVVSDGFGTCIDLALTFAACLEAVDIHPVIFLTHGHAFPGYWRRSDAQKGFQELVDEYGADRSAAEGLTVAEALGEPMRRWHLRSDVLPLIQEAIAQGSLVPIESVGLTDHSSFQEAIEEARTYFVGMSDFDAMLDVIEARGGGITPLPLSRTGR